MSISQIANISVRGDLGKSTSAYQKTLEQLSSGYKYTTLSQNPVAVSEATKLQIGINFNTRLQDNIALGNDMLQMTEDYQQKVTENVQRIKDLTIQAGSGVWTDTEKSEILEEIQSRLSYVNSIAKSANFNGTNLMDGSAKGVGIKYGSNVSESLNIDSVLINTTTGSSGLNIDLAAITGADLTDSVLDDYMTRLDAAELKLTNNAANIGAMSSRLNTISDNLIDKSQYLTSYKSSIMDSDVAEVSADSVKYQIMSEVSSNLFIQMNSMEKLRTSLFTGSS